MATGKRYSIQEAVSQNKFTDPKQIVQICYTITELAILFGYSRQGMRKVLLRYNIPIHYHGARCIVWLSDITKTYPELYSSMLEAYGILATLNRHNQLVNCIQEKIVEDDAFSCLAQFI